jgi:catechol 2,3-dioxygenase-like lactoylglutathione lyase family enzyme
MVNTFRHVMHCVYDMARTRKFYEDVFDFRLVREHPRRNDPDWLAAVAKILRMPEPFEINVTFMELDGSVLEFVEFPIHGTAAYHDWVTNRPGLGYVSIGVTDIDDVKEKVRKAGGEVLDDTLVGSGVMVKDLDGQVIEVVQDH